MAFVEPDAGRTGDALEHQGGFAPVTAVARGRHELLLHAGVIEQFELAEFFGDQGMAAFRRGRITVMVIGAQAMFDDRAGHSLAAGATGGFLPALEGDRIAGAVGHIQAAVETAGVGRRRCRALRIGRERHGEVGED